MHVFVAKLHLGKRKSGHPGNKYAKRDRCYFHRHGIEKTSHNMDLFKDFCIVGPLRISGKEGQFERIDRLLYRLNTGKTHPYERKQTSKANEREKEINHNDSNNPSRTVLLAEPCEFIFCDVIFHLLPPTHCKPIYRRS